MFLKHSGARKNTAEVSHTATLHIFGVFKSSGTQSNAYRSLLAALMNKPSVLKWLGTNAKECGSIHTASSYISCVLRCPGISLIHRGTFS